MSSGNPIYDLFRSANRKRQHAKGSAISLHGDPFEFVYYIEEGLVRVSDVDSAGVQRTVSIFSKGHIFPVVWPLNIKPDKTIYDYHAITKTVIYRLPWSNMKDFMDKHTDFYKNLADVLTKSYVNASARVINLQKTNVRERVEFILYYLAVILGTIKNGVAEIPVMLTQQEIADLAGLTRESVSHEMSKVRYKDVFWKAGNKSYIDLSKLRLEKMQKIFPVG